MKTHTTQYSVTIGIPAHNEERNITNLLLAVLAQRQDGFAIREILVVSDGSTDATVANARSVKDPRIVIVDGKERLGKNQRLNYIFKQALGDIIVILDADVIPVYPDTFANLIKPFFSDERVGYAAGKLVSRPARTFIEQCTIVSRSVWDKLRIVLNGGNSVYSYTGGIYALSRSFARQAQFPREVWADIYLYFACIAQGFQFRSSKSAAVWFQSPTTVREYLDQMKRYSRESKTLISVFGHDIVEREYYIPRVLLYRYKCEALVRYPVHSVVIFFLNMYASFLMRLQPYADGARWQILTSSKGEQNNG
jgi:glycosyltransferase involved in cell wall biosynthesis